MELEGSLPHSQVPTACPYPQPDQSSPFPLHDTSKISILILSSHLSPVFSKCLFPTGSPTQNPVNTSPIRATSLAHLTDWLDYPNNICLGVHIIKLLIV